MSSTRASRFLGVGSYVPSRVVTNDDLSKMMDTSDEWIFQRTGIKQRFWAEPTSATSDLALQAALRALESAKVKKEEIQMIIFATLSPDHEFPGTGCFLQQKLGIAESAVLDIRQQCCGFLYGISIADQYIRSGQYNKVLVVGAEIHSKGMDISTSGREVAVLFGDGAGAAVLSSCEVTNQKQDPHLLSTHLYADGTYAKELWTPAPGTGFQYPQRLVPEMLKQRSQFPVMNGKSVFVHATKRMAEVVQTAVEHNQLKMDEIDLFIFHQANLRINEMVAKKLNIPENKVFNTIEKYGNTTAATIPIGLSEAVSAGRLKPGMLVASAAFGSGFTWASAVYRW